MITLSLLAIAPAQNSVNAVDPDASPTQATSASPLTVTLQDAIAGARKNNPEYRAALTAYGSAKEGRVQGRAALLPSLNYDAGFLYTQGNGTSTGHSRGRPSPPPLRTPPPPYSSPPPPFFIPYCSPLPPPPPSSHPPLPSIGAHENPGGRAVVLGVEKPCVVVQTRELGSAALYAAFFRGTVRGQSGAILWNILPRAGDRGSCEVTVSGDALVAGSGWRPVNSVD